MKLQEILDAVTATESKLIPIFVHNPQSQSLVSVALVAEQVLFGLIKSLHAPAEPAKTN